MATSSQPPSSSRPLPEFGASPPNQTFFDIHNVPGQTAPHQNGNGNGDRVQHRLSTEFKNGGSAGYANGHGNGAMPVPSGMQHPRDHVPNGGSRHRGTVSMGTFDGPRSPPNTKNTSHVPCKFYRSGQCQAGKACPFSHDDNPTLDIPCKYFAKGNCKFGAKCALAHILPNGRRVNRPHGPLGGAQLNLGGRVDPQLYQQSDPTLTQSLLAQQTNGIPIPFGHQIPPYAETEFGMPQHTRDDLPTIDTGYPSQPDFSYGSPQDNGRNPISPIGHLSVLDVPMPASFDSQGISYIARHGAVAASVPSKFGLESPPSSLPKKVALPNDAVRHLHSSAWGREARTRGPDLGSSPLGSGDEGFGQRIMHSKRTAKPGYMSASLPRQRFHITDDDDEAFAFSGEEDFIPGNLQDIVLTPEERKRRISRTEQDSRSFRESLSGLGSPADGNSKVGSPAAAGSPSRYGAFFAARQKQEENNNSMASAFGHVGSPLRNSSLHPLTSPSLRATRVNGDISPAFASPAGHTSGISQLLARARLSDSNDTPTISSSRGLNNNMSHSAIQRNPSSASNLTNRAVSSSSIGGTGRIDEEQDGIFSMEEEGEEDHRKRFSGHAWGYSSGKASPKHGTIGSGRGGAFG